MDIKWKKTSVGDGCGDRWDAVGFYGVFIIESGGWYDTYMSGKRCPAFLTVAKAKQFIADKLSQ